MKEVCVSAAIRLDDGTVISGRCHADCMCDERVEAYVRQDMQGFLTALGRFVHRDEGLRLQLAAGVPSARGQYHDRLFSEDLPSSGAQQETPK